MEGGGRGVGWLVGGSISGVRDILAIKPVNIFYTGGVRLQRCTKDGYGYVNFLKIPPANVQSREAAFECARWGGGGAGGRRSEDWNLWQLFATGFLRYATAQFTEFLWLLIIDTCRDVG